MGASSVTASVIVPAVGSFDRSALGPLIKRIAQRDEVAEVLLAGELSPELEELGGSKKVKLVDVKEGRGAAIKAALALAGGSQVVLQDPDPAYDPAEYAGLLEPLASGQADAVYGVRSQNGHRPVGRLSTALADRMLALATGAVTGLFLSDSTTGLKAFGREVLRALSLKADGHGIDEEIAFKLSAQGYRVHEVGLRVRRPTNGASVASRLARLGTLAKYATAVDDADNLHEGYTTLRRLESEAPRYNAWLVKKMVPHLGRRVLEVGAGIGTMTRELAKHSELLVALEVDAYYVERLKNLFRGSPHVVPTLANASNTDWASLKKHRLDTVVMSNVLEHIEDDAQLLSELRSVLVPGGRVVVIVPALPALFGSLDEAVGHFRRYSPAMLKEVFSKAGFEMERVEWMNFTGIAGWFLNAKLLKKRALPPLQLRAYDLLMPALARVEERLKPPVGLSLLAVAVSPS